MALPSDSFLPNHTGSTNGKIIRAIIYMVDITSIFFLKLWLKAVGLAPSRISGMNTFSHQRAALFNYFFSTGIQLRPELRLEGNMFGRLNRKSETFETT